ncbi:MAG: LysR substrate-binding domain-containing protein [Quadrisphaera sp.]
MSRRPDVTLAQMRYFERAAAHGSMTKAAAELRIAQSAVSAAVAQLERRVGSQVFIRQRARGLVLTAAGEELLSDVRSALAHVDEVLDAAQGRGEEVRGRLRLACFVTLAPFVLPDLLADVAEHHPAVTLEVVETQAETLGVALRSGAAELGLSYDLGLGEEFERQVIGEIRPHVLLPADHRLADREQVALQELRDEPLVLLDLPHSRDYFAQVLASAGLSPVARHRSQSFETVRGMVAHGMGYSVLHLRPRDDMTYSGARVRPVAISDDVEPLAIVLARLRSVRPTARERAVAARARSVLRRSAIGVARVRATEPSERRHLG